MCSSDVLLLYWIDALESQGCVRLFGRARISEGTTTSCCLSVRKVNKKAYACPRKQKLNSDDLSDIEAELISVASRFGISIGSVRSVDKNYAFEHQDVPYGMSEFVEFTMDSIGATLFPIDISGRTFCRIIGSTAEPLETLIIGNEIMGPEWLEVRDFVRRDSKPETWCRLEISVESQESIVPMRLASDDPPIPIPWMNVIEIDARCSGDALSVVSLRSKKNINVVDDRPPYDSKVKVISGLGERQICEEVLRLIDFCDPDIVIGDSLSVIPVRSQASGALGWSRLGKMRGATKCCSGMVVCDVGTVAGDLVRKPLRSHHVSDIAEAILSDSKEALNDAAEARSEDPKLSSPAKVRLSWMITYKLGALPLTLHTTSIAGNVWSHTIAGRRSEQNDYLLMHAFGEMDFVLPDAKPPQKNVDQSKAKAAYSGGHVIEPKPGLYSKTMTALLDFSSMYPSIIRGKNVCLSTKVDGSGIGVLPRVVGRLMDERKEVKRKMRESHSVALDVRQAALKLVSNSLYGCLGFEHSRFFDRSLAAKVTEIGRDTLGKAQSMVSGAGYRVIYGDTDSLMIDTGASDLETARRVARDLVTRINASFEGEGLEMAIDGMFSSVLLISKKKYACVDAASGTCSFKGMDLVRRDWCALSGETSRSVAESILKLPLDSAIREITSAVSRAAAEARDPHAKIDKFVITKCLGKDPDRYGSDVRALPHVRVAKKSAGKHFRAGDFVAYVMCKGEEPNMPGTHLALAPSPTVEIDPDWYIEKQLYPALARVCRPVPELGGDNMIAECLGMQSRSSTKRKRTPTLSLDTVIAEISRGENPLRAIIAEEHLSTFEVNCSSESLRSQFIRYVERIRADQRLAPLLAECIASTMDSASEDIRAILEDVAKDIPIQTGTLNIKF